jgi:hypothetical protein
VEFMGASKKPKFKKLRTSLHTYVRRGKRVEEAKVDLARVQGEAASSG